MFIKSAVFSNYFLQIQKQFWLTRQQYDNLIPFENSYQKLKEFVTGCSFSNSILELTYCH